MEKKYRIPRKIKKKLRTGKYVNDAQIQKLITSYCNTPMFKTLSRQLDILWLGVDMTQVKINYELF